MAANSNLICPQNSNNIPSLRFIDPKMLGVIVGSQSCSKICLSNFFVPLSNWSFNILTLKPNETKRIDISNIGSLGERKEIYHFNTNSYFSVSPIISAPVRILISGNKNGELIFDSGLTIDQFIVNCNISIRNSNFNEKLYCEKISETVFKLYSKEIGISYTYNIEMNFGSTPSTLLEGELIQSHIRYPNRRLKVLFLMIDYDEKLYSNLKHIQYAFDDDYQDNFINATFRNFGKMLFLTSDDDVDETDMNLIETVWLKNTQKFNVTIKSFLAI